MPDNEPIDVTPIDDQANSAAQPAADAAQFTVSQPADAAAQQVPPAPQPQPDAQQVPPQGQQYQYQAPDAQQVPPQGQPQYVQAVPPSPEQQYQYQASNAQQVPPQGQQVPPQGQQQYAQQPWVPKYAAGEKNYLAAGLLAIFLGTLGIHKFYMGYTTEGVIMLLITLIGGLLSFGIACIVVEIIALIEGIIYITKGQQGFDDTYILHKKGWF